MQNKRKPVVCWWPGSGGYWRFHLDDLGKAEFCSTDAQTQVGRVLPRRVALMVGFLTHFGSVLPDYKVESAKPKASVSFQAQKWNYSLEDITKNVDWGTFQKIAESTVQSFIVPENQTKKFLES